MEIGASSTADVIRAEARVAGLGALSSALGSPAIARTTISQFLVKRQSHILPRELELRDLNVILESLCSE